MRRTITRTAVLATASAAALVITSCAGAPAEDASADPQPTETVTETVTPTPTATAADDELFTVRATANVPSGAALDVTVTVGAPIAATDAPQAALDAFASYCPDYVTPTRFADEAWSYYPITIDTVDVGTEPWSSADPVEITTTTSSQTEPTAVTSLSPDIDMPQDPAGEAGPCLVYPVVAVPVEAAQVAYTVHDDAPGVGSTDGTGWGFHRFGISAQPFATESSQVTLSDCAIEVTDLGEASIPADRAQVDVDDGIVCTTGADIG